MSTLEPSSPAHLATPPTGTDAFPRGGGDMGARMRAHDWSGSPLGAPSTWPQGLRTAVRLMLNSSQAMCIAWGPQLCCLYNDAFGALIGPEHALGSLGRPARQAWPEIWGVMGPQLEQVLQGGGPTWHADQVVPVTRQGVRDDVYWSCSHSPIDDETAAHGVGGVLVICTETTRQVLAARQSASECEQLAQLLDQAPAFMALLRGAEHRFQLANPAFVRWIGDRPVRGRTASEVLPETNWRSFLGLLDQVFRSGVAYTDSAARFDIPPEPGGPVTERFVDLVLQPVRDGDGLTAGVFVHGIDVTDRSRVDRALRESEANFRAALRAGRMGSWETDRTTMTRTWSDEGMALFGLQLPGGKGQVGGDADEYIGALHPEDRHIAARLHATADRQDSFAAAYRIVRPDGTVLWLEGRGQVVARGADVRAQRLISIMADATERKQADDVLRIERERLALALSAGQMGAYDLHIATGTLWWSPHTYTLFGVSPETFLPTQAGVTAMIHPDDRESYQRLRLEAIQHRRPFSHVFRICRPDGTQLWAGNRGEAEYDAHGVPLRSYGIVMDITERRQIEDVLRDTDRQKDIFIATLAHELRNPLAPIRNAVKVLKRAGPVSPNLAWCHEVIDRQAGQMARLLDDLLDVSRMSHHQLQLRLQPLSLVTLIEHAVELAQTAIDAGEHVFTVDLPEEPLTLHGDQTRLAQVFSNVLINAAKYTPPRGRITLTVRRQGSEAVTVVTDTGIGIQAEHVPRIFELFGQIESARTYADGGQGIGLSLAKGLVELHGGSIGVRSEGEGRGSQFEIRLPLASGAAVPETSADGAAKPERQRVCRVLIVDDMRDIADSLALLMQAMGHNAEAAYDGEQALRLAQTLRPDVMLIDIGMPRMDGYELCRRIRAEPWGSALLLVAQTGWGQDEDRRRSLQAGFDHHVVKPIDPALLVSLIAAHP